MFKNPPAEDTVGEEKGNQQPYPSSPTPFPPFLILLLLLVCRSTVETLCSVCQSHTWLIVSNVSTLRIQDTSLPGLRGLK